MNCRFFKNGTCDIASRLAGELVMIPPNACNTCRDCFAPFSENYVTASLAIYHFTKKGEHAAATELRERLQAQGLTHIGRRPPICRTGCQLKRILERLGVTASKTCNCDEFAADLDALHPQEIRDRHSEIGQRLAEHLRDLIDENAAVHAAEELGIDEPTEPDLKIPWWIRVGHRIPGASCIAASYLVLLAADRAEAEMEAANNAHAN